MKFQPIAGGLESLRSGVGPCFNKPGYASEGGSFSRVYLDSETHLLQRCGGVSLPRSSSWTRPSMDEALMLLSGEV